MSMKIWRDREANPYAVSTSGRFLKIGKNARKEPVTRFMRRLDYSLAGVGVARKGEADTSTSDDPGSRRRFVRLLATNPLTSSGFAI